MSENFLNKFSMLKTNTRNISARELKSITLPQSDCNNGFPIDKYPSYGGNGVNAWEVLYSIWNSYQSTIGAQFTLNQDINKAPDTNTNSNTIGPSNIFIIRHGEKNSSSLPNYLLNNNGIYRACQLMKFVNILAEEGNPISYIITANPCPYNTSDASMRTIQTISMVSFMLNIPIFIYGGDQDFSEVVSQLFSNDSTNPFNGLNILICWEHAAIQGLCLNILNEAGNINRLPNNCSNGDDFFKLINPCADGNYKCNDKTNKYYPPLGASNSEYYPYWNTENYDSVYWIKSDSQNIFYDFKIFNQPCLTCYSSCDIHIGLYQPLNPVCESSNKYPGEDSCELPPSRWKKI